MLDVNAAIEAREDAIARAEAGASEEWKAAALAAVYELSLSQQTMTSESVWERLGIKPNEHRAMGPIMRRAANAGYIEPTNEWFLAEDPVQHRRPLRIWRSLLFDQG